MSMETGMCCVCIHVCINFSFFLVHHYFVCSLDNCLVGNTIRVYSIELNTKGIPYEFPSDLLLFEIVFFQTSWPV